MKYDMRVHHWELKEPGLWRCIDCGGWVALAHTPSPEAAALDTHNTR